MSGLEEVHLHPLLVLDLTFVYSGGVEDLAYY